MLENLDFSPRKKFKKLYRDIGKLFSFIGMEIVHGRSSATGNKDENEISYLEQILSQFDEATDGKYR